MKCLFPLLPAVLGLVLSCCAMPRYFDLQADAPQERARMTIDKTLAIDRVEINETYRDYRIILRDSPFRVKYANVAQWSKAPDDLIVDAVLSFWRGRALFKKITAWDSPVEPDWIMRIRIEALEKYRVGRRWQARLAMAIEIAEPEEDLILLAHAFDRRLELGGKRDRLLPEAISRILREELLKVEATLLQELEKPRA